VKRALRAEPRAEPDSASCPILREISDLHSNHASRHRTPDHRHVRTADSRLLGMDRDAARARRIELLEQGPLDAAVREEVAQLNEWLRECVTCGRETDGRGRCASCAARITFAAAATSAGETSTLLEKAAEIAAEEARGHG
jgi:hypothetical protein